MCKETWTCKKRIIHMKLSKTIIEIQWRVQVGINKNWDTHYVEMYSIQGGGAHLRIITKPSLIMTKSAGKHDIYFNRPHFQCFSYPPPPPVDKIHAPKVKSWSRHCLRRNVLYWDLIISNLLLFVSDFDRFPGLPILTNAYWCWRTKS